MVGSGCVNVGGHRSGVGVSMWEGHVVGSPSGVPGETHHHVISLSSADLCMHTLPFFPWK